MRQSLPDSTTLQTFDPPDLMFPFKSDGNGGALKFSWRRFNWESLVGTQDRFGYWVTNWTPRTAIGPLKHKLDKVHRVVWEVHRGAIPAGLEIDHVDGDKSNNRIDNLQLVTHAENVRLARERKGNWLRAANAKLTDEQRQWIISLPSKSKWGMIALELKVHKVTLLNIRCKARKALMF